VATRSALTDRQLLALAAQRTNRRFEVIDGAVVDVAATGILHNIVAGNAYTALKGFVYANRLGYVFTDDLIYVLQRDEAAGVRRTRIPDVSFVRKGRIPKDFDLSLPFPGAPDLAIEVMSPDDTADEVLARIRDYLTYGSQQVWVLYPNRRQRELHQYIAGEASSHIYTGQAQIDTTGILPGLVLIAEDLFIVPDFSE
jgi:Uma2 family endonuclease